MVRFRSQVGIRVEGGKGSLITRRAPRLTQLFAGTYNYPFTTFPIAETRLAEKVTVGDFTHFNEAGHARMVDVSAKAATERVATAQARVLMRPETLEAIRRGKIAKGDVLAVALVLWDFSQGIRSRRKSLDSLTLPRRRLD